MAGLLLLGLGCSVVGLAIFVRAVVFGKPRPISVGMSWGSTLFFLGWLLVLTALLLRK